MEKQQNKDFKNIDYGEILDFEEKEKDPLLFAGHFRCTTDWENKTYVRDEHGDLIPWEENSRTAKRKCFYLHFQSEEKAGRHKNYLGGHSRTNGCHNKKAA